MSELRTPIAELLSALTFLPDELTITVSVSVRELRAALEAKAGGPRVLTAEQAAQHVGRTADYWRRAAKRGELAGAWQDSEHGPWRLPREACEAHLRNAQHRRRAPTHVTAVIPFSGRGKRGPRRSPSAASAP